MKLLQIYYQFILSNKPTLEIGEITLVPEYDEIHQMIFWRIKNPKKVSYARNVLQGYVDELLDRFSDYMGKELWKKLDGYQKVLSDVSLYLTPEQENKFLEYAKKSTTFNYKELLMDIQPFDVYPTMDRDGMYFTISVICKNPFDKETNKYLSYNGLKDKLDYYKEWDSYFDYVSDPLFTSLMNYVWSQIPTLFDNTYMVTNCDIRYFTPDKKEIRLW